MIRAFGGVPSAAVPLGGGQGTSWRAGGIVLKPDGRPLELAWRAQFVQQLRLDDHIRVSRQLRCSHGDLSCDGWASTEWLEGHHRTDKWSEMLAVSEDFHAAAGRSTAGWPRFMEQRSDPWSRATRVAWGEEALPPMPPSAAKLVREMHDLLTTAPDVAVRQVVHSDLAGNVLFADDLGLPPAVIDISPQFRPVDYAEAVLVADAVAWNGAPLSFAEAFLEESAERIGDLARAVIFRVATAALVPGASPARVLGEADAYRSILPALMPPERRCGVPIRRHSPGRPMQKG